MATPRKSPGEFSPRNALCNLALDLWEIADDYGTKPVSAAEWCARYRKKTKTASAMRAFERLKAKIRQSPFPVEFVPVLVTKNCEGRDVYDQSATSLTYESMAGLGIRLPRGARAELTKILDAHSGVTA